MLILRFLSNAQGSYLEFELAIAPPEFGLKIRRHQSARINQINSLHLLSFADACAAAIVRRVLDVHLVEQYLGEQLLFVELFSVDEKKILNKILNFKCHKSVSTRL